MRSSAYTPEFAKLKQIARLWGWHHLRRYQHLPGPDAPPGIAGSLIVWYESGDIDRLMLQINRAPEYRATVFALKYGICSGGHDFKIFDSDSEYRAEAERLESVVSRHWFSTLEMRRRFRMAHPEYANFSWDRIRKSAYPHH